MVAAASPGHASPVPLILLIAGIGVVWVISLLLWPYGPCRRCDGTGKNVGSNGRRWGTCRRCKGTGRRLRFGARLVHRIILRREVR